LAQGITRPLLNITLNVRLFCGGIQFFENFTLCDLNKFDVILGNTCLDAYKVDILCNENKLKIWAKVSSKLVNLDAEYNYMLAKVGINLVALTNELSFLVFWF
jgi:hypothetical protein